MRLFSCLVGAASISGWLTACAFAADNVDLPVTRIAVFSSGVSYYESEREVSDAATAELRFRTDQINDILKSLIVQDLGGGSIGVVSYASQDPIDKTLRSFGVDLTGKPTLADLLGQLRGEPVALTGSKNITGTILGVEKQTVTTKEGVVTIDILNLLTAEGILHLPLSELNGIKLTDEKINSELQKALATLATGHDADRKPVTLRFDGKGSRKVRVGYLLEAPIWKTSYRLALSPESKPFLQGWATVENATQEDWKNVKLSLISGRPISFRMDLYTPLYIPRPKEELELYASLRPPTYEGAEAAKAVVELDKSAGKEMAMRRAGRAPAPAAPAMKSAAADAELGGGWMGNEAPPLQPGLGVDSVANAKEAGELFEYAIKTPVTIARQTSAMLPIVNQEVEIEKVSIYNPATHPKHPLNGLQFTNSTGLNLMQGPVTVFDGNMYAGDAKLPDMKPNEKRLVAYALDLGTEVAVEAQPQPDYLLKLRIAKGIVIETRRWTDQRTYNVKNKLERNRVVLIEQPIAPEWKLVEPKEPYEKTPALLRFRVDAAAGKTTPLTVKTERVGDTSYALSNVNFDWINMYVKAKEISPAVKQALEKVAATRTALDQLVAQIQGVEKTVNEAVADQTRIRENLKTLQQGSDVHTRQMKKFDDLETQIDKGRGQLAELRATEQKQRRELDEYLLNLNVE